MNGNSYFYHSQRVKEQRSFRKIKRGWRSHLTPLLLLSCSCYPPSPISVPCFSSPFSLWPTIHLPFSLLPHSLRSPLSSTVSSQCKGILPWETVKPLSVDFWPGFHNDAKQATRTSQCDAMAGCPLNTRARTKWDCQCCPWCMHIQTEEEVHTWIKMCCT